MNNDKIEKGEAIMPNNKTVTTNLESRPRRNLLTFKQFLLSKQNGSTVRTEDDRVKSAIKKLREQTHIDSDAVASIFAVIEVGSRDREATLRLLGNEIRKMSDQMDIAITVVPLP
jgi:hypothetical protein